MRNKEETNIPKQSLCFKPVSIYHKKEDGCYLKITDRDMARELKLHSFKNFEDFFEYIVRLLLLKVDNKETQNKTGGYL